MPELPDIVVYIEALEARVLQQVLEGIRIASPFVLRSVDPPIAALNGRRVTALHRLGKQIVLEFEGELFLIIHLMIAGRLQWKASRAPVPGKVGLAAFDFQAGTLILTEAGSKKRASLHAARGREALAAFNRKALEVLNAPLDTFESVLRSENHTLKRSLTDPRLFSGIGNAYSDEILHRARLSPMKLTSKLSGDEVRRLWEATQVVLREWTERLREQTGGEFPSKVTAFRPEMAVHGRYGKPCPVCGSPVQRIVYAENECNYCATCQTDGRLLADRAMSRLLKEDWPRSLDEMEKHFEKRSRSSDDK
jgi:formamidopyrimidine-DNA glycosylase